MKTLSDFHNFFLNSAVKFFFRLYRLTFGALFLALGVRCRFEPSCSEYGEAAIRKFGFLKGSLLASVRICRCHPLSSGGLDPLPTNFSFLHMRKQ